MKHVLSIDELFESKYNLDEETALGILKKMNSEDIDIIEEKHEIYNTPQFIFTIDNFKIKVEKIYAGIHPFYIDKYCLYIDSVKINCNNRTAKEIWKKAKFDQHKYLKKDAHIHFSKNK